MQRNITKITSFGNLEIEWNWADDQCKMLLKFYKKPQDFSFGKIFNKRINFAFSYF